MSIVMLCEALPPLFKDTRNEYKKEKWAHKENNPCAKMMIRKKKWRQYHIVLQLHITDLHLFLNIFFKKRKNKCKFVKATKKDI